MTKNFNFVVEGFGADTGQVSIPMADATADDALDLEVGNVTMGWLKKRSITAGSVNLAGSTPVDPAAQVELGLRVYWTDDVTGRTGYFTIPAPDLDTLTISGNEVNMADAGPAAALKLEIDTNGASPIDGNPITVSAMRIVGR